MIRGPLYFSALAITALSGPVPAAADGADRLCDPVTNVCFCTGGWDGAECAAMRPLCEPGFWRACSDTGVCSCTRKTWVFGEGADEAPTGPDKSGTDQPRAPGAP